MSHVDKEVALIQDEIRRLGTRDPKTNKYTIKYGTLVRDDKIIQTFEAVFGTLKAAKKRKLVDFAGELLLSPTDDNVDIVLLAE